MSLKQRLARIEKSLKSESNKAEFKKYQDACYRLQRLVGQDITNKLAEYYPDLKVVAIDKEQYQRDLAIISEYEQKNQTTTVNDAKEILLNKLDQIRQRTKDQE